MSVQVVCGTMGLPTATVQMLGPDGITHVATGLGTGPVDAAYKAIDSLIRVPVRPAHTLAKPPEKFAFTGWLGWMLTGVQLLWQLAHTCCTGK